MAATKEKLFKPVVVPFFISHLGCPHRCVFCNQEKIAGGGGTLPDAAAMLEKIERYRVSAGGRELEVAFYGGTFTALPERDQRYLLGALQPLLRAGSVKTLRLSTRPDAVDAGVAAFLAEMGVRTVELGVQSMDEEVLRRSGRGHSAADVENAVGALRGAGISVGIQLMPGLPGDSDARSLASLGKVLALRPSFLRYYPTLVISGTKLADLYRSGEYLPQSLEEAVSLCKRMVMAARRGGVPVVRLGLQPTAELESPGILLAGPYHPAFGQLVESELVFDVMRSLAARVPEESDVVFHCATGRLSDLVGQKRRNVARLADLFGISVTAVLEDAALPPDAISLEWSGGRMTANLLD